MLNGTGRLGDSGEDGEICYSSGCWDLWDLMNAAPITSAAPAVHQELIGTLAEPTRVRRLRDQQQRRWDQPQPARSGAERRPAASHDEPDASTDLSVASLLPHTQSRSFGHAGSKDATDRSVLASGSSWLAAGRRSAPDRAGCG